MISEECFDQLKSELGDLDTSTVQSSGFPRIGRPLFERHPVVKKIDEKIVEKTFELYVDPMYYGIQSPLDVTKQIVTPARFLKLLELLEHKELVRSYLGIEPSSAKPHIGHILPLVQMGYLRQLYGDSIRFNILIADVHYEKAKQISMYDEEERQRTLHNVTSMRDTFKKLFPFAEIVIGREFQGGKDIGYGLRYDPVTRENYAEDTREMKKYVTEARARRAVSTLLRKEDDDVFVLANLDYPIYQAVDLKNVGGVRDESGVFIGEPVDLVFAGPDQTHTYGLAIDNAKRIRLKTPAFLYSRLITSLAGPSSGKMSKSDARIGREHGIIWYDDSRGVIEEKMMMAFCPERIVENNPVMELFKYFVFQFYPYSERVCVRKDGKYGREMVKMTPDQFLKSYQRNEIKPTNAKELLTYTLSSILESMNR